MRIYGQSILFMMLMGNMYLIVCYLEEMFRRWWWRIRSTTSDVDRLPKDFCTPFPSHLPARQALASQLASVSIDPRLENSLVAASDGPERKATEQPMSSEKSPCSWPFDLSNINNEWQICHNIIWVTDKIWYMAKGHRKVGWAPIGFAVAAPCTNLPESIVLGWAPIGFAAMATPRPSQYYFGLPNFVRYSYQ